MTASLRALLTGIIDYAGLFPPAKLPLDEAICNYARYRTEPEAWMLGRFVCPASRLQELRPFHEELFSTGPPFAFSILGTGGESFEQWNSGLASDIARIVDFDKEHNGRTKVEAYEVKLSIELARISSSKVLDWLILSCGGLMAANRSADIGCFYEIHPWAADGWGALQVIETIQRLSGNQPQGRFGLKLRCGGVEARAFPSAAQLSTILAQQGVTFKCTAGLHHPLRHWDSGLQVHMHGFINVFGAGMLAEKHALDEKQVQAILEDEDPANFTFTDAAFRWRDLEVGTSEIVELRKTRMTSFGSCSFDEPREDLKKLGWLD